MIAIEKNADGLVTIGGNTIASLVRKHTLLPVSNIFMGRDDRRINPILSIETWCGCLKGLVCLEAGQLSTVEVQYVFDGANGAPTFRSIIGYPGETDSKNLDRMEAGWCGWSEGSDHSMDFWYVLGKLARAQADAEWALIEAGIAAKYQLINSGAHDANSNSPPG